VCVPRHNRKTDKIIAQEDSSESDNFEDPVLLAQMLSVKETLIYRHS
jgi:hypothetical protein